MNLLNICCVLILVVILILILLLINKYTIESFRRRRSRRSVRGRKVIANWRQIMRKIKCNNCVKKDRCDKPRCKKCPQCQPKVVTTSPHLPILEKPIPQSQTFRRPTTPATNFIAQRYPNLKQSKSCGKDINCMDCQDHIYKLNKSIDENHPNPLFSKTDLENNICSGSKSSNSHIGCKKFCYNSINQY